MGDSLRSRIIRLAHERPDLRSQLLPLLQKQAQKVKTDRACMRRYQTEAGDFKGGKGDAFDNCVKAFTNCSNAKNPEGLCAHIGRQTGKIKASLAEGLSAKEVAEQTYKAARDLGESPEMAVLVARIASQQYGS